MSICLRYQLRILLLLYCLFQLAACDLVDPDKSSISLQKTLLVAETRIVSWMWSADGTEIIYLNDSGISPHDTDFDDFSIRAINASTGEERVLVPEMPGQQIVRFGFALSGDGKYVIYKSYTGDPSVPAIKRVAVNGNSAPETLLVGVGEDGFAFSPDMARVALQKFGQKWNEVTILDMQTREEHVVEGADSGIDEMTWSPDGSMLLVGSSGSCKRIGPSTYATEISLIDLSSTSYSSALVPCWAERPTEVSPLRDAVWSGNEVSVGALLLGGVFSRIQIPSGERSDIYSIRAIYGPDADIAWSPDGRSVTYWHRECTKMEDIVIRPGQYCTASFHELIYVTIDADERHSMVSFTTNKLPGGGESGAPRFSPDGRKIAFKVSGDLHVVDRP